MIPQVVGKDLQELVEEGEEAREDDGHDPVTESHDGQTWLILVGDNGGDLGNRRVLFFLEDDRGTLSIDLLVDEVVFSKIFLLVVGHGGGRMRDR
jgi:hypothetical protein